MSLIHLWWTFYTNSPVKVAFQFHKYYSSLCIRSYCMCIFELEKVDILYAAGAQVWILQKSGLFLFDLLSLLCPKYRFRAVFKPILIIFNGLSFEFSYLFSRLQILQLHRRAHLFEISNIYLKNTLNIWIQID